MNVKEDTFEVRRDKYFFMKLSKKPEPFEYLLANISSRGTKAWIGDIIDSSGEETYLAWKKRKESLSYNFKSELSNLKDELDDNLVMDGGNHPYLLRLYLLKEFSLDSLCIMNAVHGAVTTYLPELTTEIAYLNGCKGVHQIIPVAVFLMTLYNACFMFQTDKSVNMMIDTLQRFDLIPNLDNTTLLGTLSK